ncbi:hypothetical protein PFISCL1PPCAC_27708 [Pristionchus fissidentatus]|uniref:Ig-like domain-containing protein n=1 Tax=Pristionchus fissidentatus TaxID=1538716 RepID=A0AAV5WZ21_9BILA|nr:hypothetical protein PFISCL1PPCAC_27708 [Pristionchus fissidentatus]
MLLLLLFTVAVAVASAEQEITEGPHDTSVHVGKIVTLNCKVSGQKGAVQWMKNGFGLGTDRALRFFPRYSMVGSAAAGEFNLRIVNATVGDDDVYACQISEADGESSIISAPAKLTVLVRPSPPKFAEKVAPTLNAIAGESLLQACVSRRGKPAPRIGWAISADSQGREVIAWLGESRAKFGNLFKQHNVGTQVSLTAKIDDEERVEGDVVSSLSNISFIPRPEDDKKYLLCISQHETFPDRVEIDSVRFNLQYAPRVKLTWAGPGALREGKPVLLACNVDARPLNDLKITWYRNQNKLLRHTTDTLAFEELKMEDHKSEYTCETSNSIGTSKDTIKLDVQFGPRMMSTSQEKEANIGESVTFQCEAAGNPTPIIYWSRAGDEQILAKGETYTIDTVEGWQQGEYICTAVVDSFEHAKLSHHLFIRGAPVVAVPSVVQGGSGESVEISCKVSGRPKTREIQWTKDGEKLSYATGRHQVHQVPRLYGVESRLIITNLDEADFGHYNCSANNGLGSDYGTVMLRQRSLIDSLITADMHVLLPIIASLLFLLFCLCCCIVCKRRSSFSKRKGTQFSDAESDVTVKCEALDGNYYPEMYGSPIDNPNIITSKVCDYRKGRELKYLKDYISVPQSNPDLDFSGAAVAGLYPKYMDNSMSDYRFDHHSYGSFISGGSTPNNHHHPEMYNAEKPMSAPGAPIGVDGTPLETLPEVDTPKASTYSFATIDGVVRPMSRTSTHV